jgi:hypothetical protein
MRALVAQVVFEELAYRPLRYPAVSQFGDTRVEDALKRLQK